ncbi:hypothetical protein [Streptomyces sp. AC1-42T]|uniref:hypothetical protein n=1 Tax=Streptomyces sp. AC1-42T TaxID=2218665 RepID=UPI000DAB713B|nr:hypothetical protein [Streptomyces sp. AC1-42T]PZT71532.1 hypothetical protein DNK55_33010 [Streptomyces sp. AC1-42T]
MVNDGDSSNRERAVWGEAAVGHYSRSRAALGKEPTAAEDMAMALTACESGGRFVNSLLDGRCGVLSEDREIAEEVIEDVLTNVFHAADGTVTPELLLRAVAGGEDRAASVRAEAWQRLGSAQDVGWFLVAVRRALVTVHDLDADGMLESAVRRFRAEAEDERFALVAERRER